MANLLSENVQVKRRPLLDVLIPKIKSRLVRLRLDPEARDGYPLRTSKEERKTRPEELLPSPQKLSWADSSRLFSHILVLTDDVFVPHSSSETDRL